MGFNLCWRLLKCDNSSTGLLCSWNKIRWCPADWWFATDVPWQMRHLYLSTPIRATGSSRGHVPRFAEETVNWLSMQTLNCARVRASGLAADLKGRAVFSGAERYRWDWHMTQSLEIHCSVCVFVCVWLFLSQCVAGFSWCFFCGVMLRHVVVLFAWHEMTWNDMKWHEMTWNDMNWHELTWNNPNCTKPTNNMIQITTKRQMTKNMSKSQTSHRHKKKLTTISPCVSWSKVGYWGMVINPLGLIWWDDHTMFCFESWYMWQTRINQDGAWTALLSLFHATNSTRCNVGWSIKSW